MQKEDIQEIYKRDDSRFTISKERQQMTDENTMKIKCPHCKKNLTDDEIKIIWGQFVSSKTKGLTSEKKKKRV